jgi:phage baseplate assembly protein W
MAAIVIDTLKRTKSEPTYRDIKLDLSLNYTYDPRLNSFDTVKDIKASEDVNAIKNSIFNIFTTMPGQKILNPTFGLNLMQFLFTPITNENAQVMGETILRGLQKFEPRVDVKKIVVLPDADNNTYQIGLRLDVPTLNIKGLGIKGILSESGYYIN